MTRMLRKSVTVHRRDQRDNEVLQVVGANSEMLASGNSLHVKNILRPLDINQSHYDRLAISLLDEATITMRDTLQ